jgi:hypothetical protein
VLRLASEHGSPQVIAKLALFMTTQYSAIAHRPFGERGNPIPRINLTSRENSVRNGWLLSVPTRRSEMQLAFYG